MPTREGGRLLGARLPDLHVPSQRSGEKLRVGLVSLYACGNTGDEALLRCVVRRLRAEAVGTSIVSLAIGPAGFLETPLPASEDEMGPSSCFREPFRMVPRNRATNWRRLILRGELMAAGRAAGNVDLLLWAGGYWLHDRRPGVLLTIAYLASRAAKTGRVGFYSVGAGPIATGLGRRLVRGIAARSSFLCVRDTSSAEALRAAGVERESIVSVDPAVELQSCRQERAQQIIQETGLSPRGPIVAICPCAWHSMDEYYRRSKCARDKVFGTLSQTADRLDKEDGLQVLFVPTMWPEDGLVAQGICEELNSSAVSWVSQQLSAPEAQGVIGCCEGLLSMRLHPLIFALNTATPLVGIAYDPKVQAFMEQIDCQDACVALNEMTCEALVRLLRSALSGQNSSPAKLAARHECQLTRALETGTLLRRALGE